MNDSLPLFFYNYESCLCPRMSIIGSLFRTIFKMRIKQEKYALIEQEELLRMQQELRDRLELEKQKVEQLRLQLPKRPVEKYTILIFF